MNHKTEDDMSIGKEPVYPVPMTPDSEGVYTDVRWA